MPAFIRIARASVVPAYVGGGENRWPAVHRDDAARLFRLALEQAAPGAVLHGVAEEGLPFRPDDAEGHFGWFAASARLDVPVSSALTRERTGWAPREASLLVDVRESGYFDEAARSIAA